MRKKLNLLVVLLFVASAFIHSSFAQGGKDVANKKSETKSKSPKLFAGLKQYNSTYIGVHLGATIPTTIFNSPSETDYAKSRTGFGAILSLRQLLSRHVGIQGEFFMGSVKGDNSTLQTKERNGLRSFETKIQYAAMGFIYFNMFSTNIITKEPELMLYSKFGAGIANVKPTVTNFEQTKVEGSATRDGMFAAGVGGRIRITTHMDFVVDYTMYFTRGDSFDGNTANPNNFGDRFSYITAGLTYALPSKTKPNLDWVNPAKLLYDELKDSTLVKRVTKLEKNVKTVSKDVDVLHGEVSDFKTDTDGDGVANFFDKCPDTPTSVKVDGSGCPLDVDGDGVFDTNDKCPTVKGPASNNGCPEEGEAPKFEEDDLNKIQEAFKNLEFAFNSDRINSESFSYLDGLAEVLSKYSYVILILHGYTDNIGTDKYNSSLSIRRSQSVKKYIQSKGVPKERIEAKGHGESGPIAENDSQEGRQKNRRVEFELVKK